MTAPHGGDVNLAALWVPIMPETSHLTSGAREAGEKARVAFQEGFGKGGSAEELGGSFANKFTQSFNSKLRGADLGLGISGLLGQVDKFGEQVDARLAAKLKGQLPQAYRAVAAATGEYAQALQRLTPVQERHAELTDQITQKRAASDAAWDRARSTLAEVNNVSKMHNLTLEQQNSVLARNNTAVTEAQRLGRELQSLEAEQLSTRRNLNNEEERTAPIKAKAAAAQQNYTELVERHTAATQHSYTVGNMFAGMLGGAMVAGIGLVVSGMESIIELGAHIFEGAVEGAEKLADRLIEIGEEYQHLNIQVSEFSSASGQALEGLQESAARVFGTLDVAGKDTGQTLAMLSSRLGLSGSALETLTSHVERLEGRFADLRVDSLASAFDALGVSGKDADDTLASWVQSAQAAGVSSGKLIESLGALGETLRPEISGLNADQLGSLLAQMDAKGPGAQRMVMGLSHAEQEFAKQHVTFAEGLKQAAQDINAATNEGDKEEIAEKLFGARNWSAALAMVQTYLDVLNKGPDAYNSNGDALDALLEKWGDLGNKVEEFKHHIQAALMPAGEAIKDLVEHDLNRVSTWFDEHHDQIIGDIDQWGKKFIDMLPTLKDFVDTAIVLFQGLAWAMEPVAGLAMEIAGGVEIMRTHVKEGLHLIAQGERTQMDALSGGDKVTGIFDTIKDKVDKGFDGIIDKSDDLKNALDGLTDKMRSVPPWIGGLPPASALPAIPPGGGVPSAPGAPEYTWSTPNHVPSIAPPGKPAVPGGIPTPPGAPRGTPTAPGNLPSFAPPDIAGSGYSSGRGADFWDRVAQAESTGNWTNADTGHNGHFGGLQFAPSTWATYGGTAFADRADHASKEQQIEVANRVAFSGWNGVAPQGLGAWETITNGQVPVGAQSGGTAERGRNSNWLSKIGHKIPGAAKSLWDFGSHQRKESLENPFKHWSWAKGANMAGDMVDDLITMFAKAGPTVAESGFQTGGLGSIGDPGHDYVKPVVPGSSEWNAMPLHSQNMATWIAMQMGVGGYQDGGKGPKDTLPVWVTPNEYIWNEEAVAKHGGLIHALNEASQGRSSGVSSMWRNAKGFQGGGGHGAADSVASGAGNDDTSQIDPQLQAITQMANSQFGLTLSAGHSGARHSYDKGFHDSGQAGDFSDGYETPQELAFAQAMFQHFGSELSELIYAGPGMPKLIKDGQVVDPSFYGADTLAGHHDHVHVAIRASQTLSDAMSPGSEPIVQGQPGGFSSTPMSFGAGGRTGATLTGWSGGRGYGGGGGQTQSQLLEQSKQLDDANYRVGQVNKDIDDKNAKLKDLNAQLATEQGKAKSIQDAAKISTLQDQIKSLQDDLKTLQEHDLPDAEKDLEITQARASEAGSKPAKGTGEDKGGDAAKDFGSKFLGGIAQSLGFPDVFGGKAPWDFGIVKMLGRFATGFVGGLQQEEKQYGGGGAGGGGGGGGFLSGMAPFKIPFGGPGSTFQGGTPQGMVPFDPTGQNQYMTAGAAPGPSQVSYHVGDVNHNVNVTSAGDANIARSVQDLGQRSDNNAQTMAQPAVMPPPPGG
jgi:Transglycosylase-like domain